jgi:hypothetical protein
MPYLTEIILSSNKLFIPFISKLKPHLMTKLNYSPRLWTIFVGGLLGIAVEVTPLIFEKYETANRIFYAFVALYLTVLIENNINRMKFSKNLKVFISDLIGIRLEFKISGEAIQSIMRSMVNNLAEILDQKKALKQGKSSDLYQDRGEMKCKICIKDHLTDEYGRCEICRTGNKFWRQIK